MTKSVRTTQSGRTLTTVTISGTAIANDNGSITLNLRATKVVTSNLTITAKVAYTSSFGPNGISWFYDCSISSGSQTSSSYTNTTNATSIVTKDSAITAISPTSDNNYSYVAGSILISMNPIF